MGWWKADPVEPPKEAPPPYQPPQASLPASHPPIASSAQADACPVDHKTREVWLQQAKRQREFHEKQQQQQPQQQQSARPAATPTPPNPLPSTTPASKQCSSDRISQSPTTDPPVAPTGIRRPLSQDREVSSIPRSCPSTATTPSTPANSESETGPHSSGNWIYPSETQFFNAVMRKATTNTSPRDLASSISSIIPIHNAVNERAWHLIRQWEGDSSKQCGGPKLLSFEGKGAGALSPMAKWNTWIMGAREPFDRHDWVVERCGGETVGYVIDFYQGKGADTGKPMDANLNFYLDVRPKLNSIEGCKMRLERLFGWK